MFCKEIYALSIILSFSISVLSLFILIKTNVIYNGNISVHLLKKMIAPISVLEVLGISFIISVGAEWCCYSLLLYLES